MLKLAFLSAAVCIVLSVTRPTPEDILKFSMEKCLSSEENDMYLAAAMGTRRSNLRTRLIDIMLFYSQGRVSVYEGPFHSSISIDKQIVAIGALYTYITPSCEDIRNNRWKL